MKADSEEKDAPVTIPVTPEEAVDQENTDTQGEVEATEEANSSGTTSK